MKIIVIGAGVAGLSAAQELKKAGHEVLVLEASNRIGGRIWTDRNFANFPIEDGAEFIHGDKVETWKYIKRDEALEAGTFEGFSSFVDGKFSSGEEFYAIPEFKKIIPLYPDADDLRCADMSVEDWVKGQDLTERAKFYLAERISNVYLARPQEIGVQDLAHESEVDHSGEGDFRVKDGYDILVGRLSSGIEVKTNTPVIKIDWKEKIKAYSNGSTFECDKIIVTVPLPILQQNTIAFNPVLPKEKLDAIASVKMGDVIKLHLVFKKAFWPGNDSWLFIAKKPFIAWWPSSYARNGVDHVFTAFITNEEARKFSKMPEKEVIDLALDYLEQVFSVKDIRSLFIKGKMVSWTNNPWIRGGYTFVPPGKFGSRQELAKSLDNKIYFAGEATVTDSNPATVHGAIESGIRAAKEILK